MAKTSYSVGQNYNTSMEASPSKKSVPMYPMVKQSKPPIKPTMKSKPVPKKKKASPTKVFSPAKFKAAQKSVFGMK